MNVYGLIDDDDEKKFTSFQLDVFVNLQRIALIFQEQINYETKFGDLFQSIRQSLVGYDICMNESADHHFVYINDRGEEEQLFPEDWNQLVKDLDVFRFDGDNSSGRVSTKGLFHTMKLEQTLGCLDINHYKLEKMIGIKKDCMVKVIPADELLLFEESSRRLFVDASASFAAMTLEEKLLVEHPIEINNTKKFYSGDINIRVYPDMTDLKSHRNKVNKTPTTPIKCILIQASNTVQMVIDKIISKFPDCLDLYLKPKEYLLKIADREEYLVSPDQLEIIKFQYISSCVQMNVQPNLILVPRKPLEESNILSKSGRGSKLHVPKVNNNTVNENAFKDMSLPKKEFVYTHDLWRMFRKSNSTSNQLELNNCLNISVDNVIGHMLDNLEHTDLLYVVKVSDIEFPGSCALGKDQKVVIIAGLYHGEKTLCEHQYREWSSDSSGCEIVFPIEIWNLPRMARFSFALAFVKQSMSLKEFSNNSQKKFIGWGNLMVYDHKSVLKFEKISYRLWQGVRPNPTGSIYSNPDGDLITPLLTMQLLPKLTTFKKIAYPPKEILILEAGKMLDNEVTVLPSKAETEKIAEILAITSIDDIMEDEQTLLWKYRYYIRDYYQESLPKILNSRPWNNFENVAKMQHLACGWPIDKEIIMALQLLGSDFPDCDIRMMASDSLSRINWEEFCLYLLQICQCLKYESYLNSNLIQMLLKRMISNAKIAQFMFYYIKVEIGSCEWCKVPFSTILYNYLQYFPVRCASLLKQYRATNEINQHNKALMQFANLEGDRKIQTLTKFRASLSLPCSKEIFDDLTCPLDCNINLKTLKAEDCKFMDSKMRPIRLSWNVNTELTKDYLLIYKNGDDLRQDALIIQMMHIMDSVWQRAGLDLRLYPYNVLACSKTEGYIQVVQKAETLANIYKSSKNRNSNLFGNWLKQNNPGREMKALVKNFTRSCGAYCVATFILGIGDRHSDNIMIREDGHFFHIDFGHILGNIKKIMGGMVPREWTKFILVQDFLQVIADGDVQKEQEFKNLCCRGYLALRKYSNLILTLFKTMVNAGIPEISNMDDLNYLKDTLQIGKSEEDAQTYFQNVYDDTRKKEMFVSLNWIAHNMRRNNN